MAAFMKQVTEFLRVGHAMRDEAEAQLKYFREKIMSTGGNAADLGEKERKLEELRTRVMNGYIDLSSMRRTLHQKQGQNRQDLTDMEAILRQMGGTVRAMRDITRVQIKQR